MRLSSLCLATVLVFSSATLAQHSSSGGGGFSGSSGGGGSHSSSGGSSSASSASTHSSGGSASHGFSASHSSNAHNGKSGTSRANASLAIRDPKTGLRGTSEGSGKRNFFSFLRHPFRRTASKPAVKTANLRYKICFKGPCLICPTAQAHGGACAELAASRRRDVCSQREIWNGGSCLLQANFLDDCSGLRMAMERQAQRMQEADSDQQSSCSNPTSQECSDRGRMAQSEANLYRTLQARYQACQRRSLTASPVSGLGSWKYSQGLRSDPLGMELNYR
jgi:hypothetical protein